MLLTARTVLHRTLGFFSSVSGPTYTEYIDISPGRRVGVGETNACCERSAANCLPGTPVSLVVRLQTCDCASIQRIRKSGPTIRSHVTTSEAAPQRLASVPRSYNTSRAFATSQ